MPDAGECAVIVENCDWQKRKAVRKKNYEGSNVQSNPGQGKLCKVAKNIHLRKERSEGGEEER